MKVTQMILLRSMCSMARFNIIRNACIKSNLGVTNIGEKMR